jgi:hypothetical protein
VFSCVFPGVLPPTLKLSKVPSEHGPNSVLTAGEYKASGILCVWRGRVDKRWGSSRGKGWRLAEKSNLSLYLKIVNFWNPVENIVRSRQAQETISC